MTRKQQLLKLIKDALEKGGCRQTEIAEALGVTRSRVNQLVKEIGELDIRFRRHSRIYLDKIRAFRAIDRV